MKKTLPCEQEGKRQLYHSSESSTNIPKDYSTLPCLWLNRSLQITDLTSQSQGRSPTRKATPIGSWRCETNPFFRKVLLLNYTQDNPYSQIDIDDLHDAESSAGIILDMQDRQRYFEGRMTNGNQESAEPVCYWIANRMHSKY